MDGKFTFRAENTVPEDLGTGWETPETATVGDALSTLASDDEYDGTAPGPARRSRQLLAGGSHHQHHHVHHHYHYHLGKPGPATAAASALAAGAPRRRHVQPATAGEHPGPEAGCVPGLEQDPLTLWHNTHGGEPAEASSAWMADMLSAHGIGQELLAPHGARMDELAGHDVLGAHGLGQEWAGDEDARQWARRQTAVTTSSFAADDDEFRRCNPHWDDMITFRQSRARVPRERAWSATSETVSTGSGAARRHVLLAMATHTLGRTVCLTLVPVAAVLAWCAVPLRTHDVRAGDAQSGGMHTHGVQSGDGQAQTQRLNFWFFLFFYYGMYNAVALALVTQIFRVYALTWWPRGMSGLLANVISWMFTTVLGALVYVLGTGIERAPMTWTSLTLLTLLLPVGMSFGSIQRHHRRTAARDRAFGSEQRPLMATSTEWRTPASYRRFLWFCSTFLLWYAALAAGEYMASAYIETLPHTTGDEFFYVYAWIAIVNVLSLTAGWVVSAKVRSWPLQYIYTLYFFTTYFIFYRNLFARLENPEQVVFLQASASLWVALIYPLRMARWVYRVLAWVCRWGDDYPYETYARQLGRAFFLRNKAENATVLGFLCWVSVLHYGPNRRHYPYFRFEHDPRGDVSYEYSLTVRASIYAWASEFVASRIVRYIFRRVYAQNISEDAVHDFHRYPHVVPALVLVTIHVLQNILFAMIHLDFQ